MSKYEKTIENKFNKVIDDITSVEVGDTKQIDFYPQIKMKHWDNECNFSIRLIDEDGSQSYDDKEDKITWQSIDGKRECNIFNRVSDEDENEIEFDLLIKEKPKSNIIRYSIQYKGLEFTYQPALTKDEIDEGCFRPDNVVGSYAVYHKSKKNNKYKTGKAFHILRPWVEDSIGTRVWCELNINEIVGGKYTKECTGELTITIPQDFIDNAVYPIYIDPTFGNTTAGSSTVSVNANDAVGGLATLNIPYKANVSKLTISSKSSSGSINMKGVIWEQEDGGAVKDIGAVVSCSTTKAWRDSGSINVNLDAGVWRLGIVSESSSTVIYYDTSGQSIGSDYTNSYSSPQSFDVNSYGSPRYASVYATYTEIHQPNLPVPADETLEVVYNMSGDSTSDYDSQVIELYNNPYTYDGTTGTFTHYCPISIDGTNADVYAHVAIVSDATGGGNVDIISDNFNDNNLDSTAWTEYDYDEGAGVGVFNEQNQRAEFSGTCYNFADAWGRGIAQESISGSFDISVKVTAMYSSNPDWSYQSAYMTAYDSGSESFQVGLLYYFGTGSGDMYIYYEDSNGVGSISIEEDFTLPMWLRIKYDETKVYLMTSTNGTVWKRRYSIGHTSDLTSVNIAGYHYIGGDLTITGYVYFDDFVNRSTSIGPESAIRFSDGTNVLAILTEYDPQFTD